MTTETLPTTAPVETVTPIKPSEAIRLGCLIAPVQAFGRYTDGPGTACATKAMHLGGLHERDDIQRAFSANGDGQHERPLCPLGDKHDGNVLAHLNDDHRWSRERIAAWLEGLGL